VHNTFGCVGVVVGGGKSEIKFKAKNCVRKKKINEEVDGTRPERSHRG